MTALLWRLVHWQGFSSLAALLCRFGQPRCALNQALSMATGLAITACYSSLLMTRPTSFIAPRFGGVALQQVLRCSLEPLCSSSPRGMGDLVEMGDSQRCKSSNKPLALPFNSICQLQISPIELLSPTG